jgi:hypothetical protein
MKNDLLLRNFEDDLPLQNVPAQDEIAGVTASSLQLPCSEAASRDRQKRVESAHCLGLQIFRAGRRLRADNRSLIGQRGQ